MTAFIRCNVGLLQKKEKSVVPPHLVKRHPAKKSVLHIEGV